nr:LuxR C-terminal-related transcriptional regulator [Kibdelosporangium sp. MJ126-NF4]CEL20559.1 hypothetical protein [Kibdelosporangium sp. MJ126-NF4]CTQ89470.1 hypothetical protein [Kibdelosporangium sp. MJ126-NF4]
MAAGTVQDLTRGLTERQREILRLIGEGFGNSAIAARLGIATKTVGNQVPSILSKLGIPDRAAAIVYAHRLRPHGHLIAC